MAAFIITVTDGHAVTKFRANLFETVVCADDAARAVAEALIYTPPKLKAGPMKIDIKPMPIIQ